MHRELKRETMRPPASNLRGQQCRFGRFRQRYNEERPHEGIEGQVPASRWQPSRGHGRSELPRPSTRAALGLRRVSAAGTFHLKAAKLFSGNPVHDEYIGLEEIGDGLWNIVFYRTLIGWVDERTRGIAGIY